MKQPLKQHKLIAIAAVITIHIAAVKEFTRVLRYAARGHSWRAPPCLLGTTKTAEGPRRGAQHHLRKSVPTAIGDATCDAIGAEEPSAPIRECVHVRSSASSAPARDGCALASAATVIEERHSGHVFSPRRQWLWNAFTQHGVHWLVIFSMGCRQIAPGGVVGLVWVRLEWCDGVEVEMGGNGAGRGRLGLGRGLGRG